MADESKPRPGAIPTLTDVVLHGRVDSLPLDEHPRDAHAIDPTEELPLHNVEVETQTPVPEPEQAYFGVRPEILPLDEIEQEMNPLEATEEPPTPQLISEPETLHDDDQLTDEVPALPLRVAALVDEILERHLDAAREEIMRRLAELIDELDNASIHPDE